MAVDDELLALSKQIGALINIVQHQQAMLYALHEYIRQQPFYDAVAFGTLFEEFQTDLVAALKKYPARSSTDAVLQMLKDFQGPKH